MPCRWVLCALLVGCSFRITGSVPTEDAPADGSPDVAIDAAVIDIDACTNCPANDVPGGAIQISTSGTFTADFANAHDDIAVSCAPGTGRDLFYELIVTGPDVVYVDTDGSNFDAAIGLFAGPCTAPGAETACSNDACLPMKFGQLAMAVDAGTYCLVIDESGAPTGNGLSFDVFFAGRRGTALTGAPPYVVSGDTCTATDVTDPACENLATSPGTAKDEMYFLPVCGGGTFTASTCAATNYDSIVYLQGRSGTVFCVDDGCGVGDGSLTSGNFTAGPGMIRVTVDGWNGGCGTYTLTVTPP